MYGGQQSWYFTALLGLTMPDGVEGAGWASIRVAPQVPSGLAGAALRLETDRGDIAVQWTQRNATAAAAVLFALSVSVPVSVSADICVPLLGELSVEVTESQQPLTWRGWRGAPGQPRAQMPSASTVDAVATSSPHHGGARDCRSAERALTCQTARGAPVRTMQAGV